jgi:hypothetical protein
MAVNRVFILRTGEVATTIAEITPLDHIEAVTNLVSIYAQMVRSPESRTDRNDVVAEAMTYILIGTPEYRDSIGDVRLIRRAIVTMMDPSSEESYADFETLIASCLAKILRVAKRLNRELPVPLPDHVLDDHMTECKSRAMRRRGFRPEKTPCATCNATGVKTRFCSRCHIYRYCSRECQCQDWSDHREACAAVAAYVR